MSQACSSGRREAVAVTMRRAARATAAGESASAISACGSGRLQIAAALRGAFGIAAPDVDPVEIEDLGVQLRLQARLNAGAEDAEDAIAAAELAGDQCGHGGGAHVGEMPGVGQEGHGFAGFRRGEEHHAVAGRQAAREVAGKSAGDLQREIFAAAAIAGLHVDLAVPGAIARCIGIGMSHSPRDQAMTASRMRSMISG